MSRRRKRPGRDGVKLDLRVIIYLAAAAALLIGFLAYGMAEEEHEEAGLLEGDSMKVVAVGTVLAVVAVASLVYLSKPPSEE